MNWSSDIRRQKRLKREKKEINRKIKKRTQKKKRVHKTQKKKVDFLSVSEPVELYEKTPRKKKTNENETLTFQKLETYRETACEEEERRVEQHYKELFQEQKKIEKELHRTGQKTPLPRHLIRKQRDLKDQYQKIQQQIQKYTSGEHMENFLQQLSTYIYREQQYIEKKRMKNFVTQTRQQMVLENECLLPILQSSKNHVLSVSQLIDSSYQDSKEESESTYLTRWNYEHGNKSKQQIDEITDNINLKESYTCPDCYEEYIIDPQHGTLVCPTCGRMVFDVNTTRNVMAFGQDVEFQQNSYMRHTYFEEWLKKIQGLSNLKCPEENFNKIMKELVLRGFGHKKYQRFITRGVIREVVKDLGMKYSEHIPSLWSLITNKPCQKMTPQQKEYLRLFFHQIEMKWKKHKSSSRKNFLSYGSTLLIPCLMLQLVNFLSDLPILNGVKNRSKHDILTKKIYEDLGFEFLSSDVLLHLVNIFMTTFYMPYVKEDFFVLNLVPKKYITLPLCIVALEQDPRAWNFIPKIYQTNELKSFYESLLV